ncbi:MAG: winged helix-turn-helix domain-containing protein [Acidobacteriota bacterium]
MRIAIDDLILDTDSFELTRRDQPVAIEPKVLELLVFLIQNRDRVVSKDELVEQVWARRHISDSALTRGIYETRRVLGDDAKRQTMIRTVYRRGYQFIGSAVELPSASPPPEPAATAVLPPSEQHRQGESRAMSPRWRRSAAGLVIVALLAAAAWWLRTVEPAQDPDQPFPGLRSVDSLAVLPMASDDTDPRLQLAALSIADQITVRFAAQPGLTVRSLELSRAADPRDLEPDRLFGTLRVDAALQGRMRRSSVAGRYRLSLDLLATDLARPMHLGVYEVSLPETAATLEAFLRVREAIAEDVLEHLSPTFANRTADAISPAHPEAFQLYLEARRRLSTITCGDASVVIDLIDRSLAFDPEYAMAWAAKGFALYSEAWSCGRDASYAERALDAAREARRRAPSLATALLLETFLLAERGDAEKAYAQVLDFERSGRPSAASRYAGAYALRYAGFLDASKAALDESLALDPLILREFSTAPVTLLYRGDIAAFLALLPAEETPHDRFYRGLALLRDGRRDRAQAMLAPAFELNPTDLFARYAASLLAVLDDDPASALELVRGVVRQRQRLGNRDGELTFKEAQLMALAGDVVGAIDRLGQAVEDGFFCPGCLRDEPDFEPLRGETSYRQWIDRAAERHRAFASRFGLDAEF